MSTVISPLGCRVAKASFASPRVPRQNSSCNFVISLAITHDLESPKDAAASTRN